MADGGSDDEVIHLASFNIHRSQGSSHRRQSELITISDDSDEEPLTRVASSPVYVPDDDDDVSILEANTPARRHVIRPAAKWSGTSFNPNQVFGQSREIANVASALLSSCSATPSTSRDTKAPLIRQAIRPATAMHSGTSEQPQPGPSTALSQPTTNIDSRQHDSTSAHTNMKHQIDSSTQTAIKTSKKVQAIALPSRILDDQPSTSGVSKHGTLAQTGIKPHASTSSASRQASVLASTVSNTSSKTQVKTGASSKTQDNPQASTSTANSQPQPSTSTQVPSSQTSTLLPNPKQVLPVLPQQPSIKASALITQPQLPLRAQAQLHSVTIQRRQGNLIQIELQPFAQAPVQAPIATHVIQEARPAVLIAAAPERLGPLEAGHTIIYGSQAANPQPRVQNPNNSVPNAEPPAPAATAAAVPHNRDNLQQPPAPNLDRADPGLGLVVVPPAREDIPRIEDARPGPSAPRERPEQQPHVRALIIGVLDLFPDAQEAYVAELIQKNNVTDLNVVCNLLLENPQYPQREVAVATVAPTSILLESGDSPTEATEDLFDYNQLGVVVHEAVVQATDLLMADFRMLSCQDIKWVLNSFKGHYAITRKALWDAYKKWQDPADPSGKKRRNRTSSERCYIDFQFEHGTVKLSKRMYFLESDRRYIRSYSNLEPSVQKELSFYLQKAKEWAEHEDFLLALQVNEDEYKKDGQLIQCGCCYGDFAFEKMTQCSDGHLFCQECLVNYAQEAVFGSGKSQLSCMSANCQCSFPVSELEKVLPENILCKYYERQAEEAVAATCADELVRCPFCNFPALLDKGISRFSCPNPRCRKESCRKCHVQWKEHMGKTCEQVLEQDEIRMRVLFEERMTAARVRKCVKCGTGLVKSEGCNRMSCRCGSFMCYLCREPITGYNHFCQHARSPGAPCRHCRKCSLWTDPTQDDERMIQDIQKEGEAELNKKCADNSGKRVGPPPEQIPEVKRPRVGPPPDPTPEPQQAPPNRPQLVQAPLFVPARARYAPAPAPLGYHMDNAGVLPRLPPAPYVPLLQPLLPLNNNNNLHQQHQNPHHNNWDMMPMHYGPQHRYYRRF